MFNYTWIDGSYFNMSNFSSIFCQDKPNNFADSINSSFNAWTYDGCIVVDTSSNGSYCLRDIPCRSGETGGLATSKYSYIMCQYQLLPNNTTSYVSVNILPPAWSTLEDDFYLYEGQFLQSINRMYQFYLKKGNLMIIRRNDFNDIIWQTNSNYDSSYTGTYFLSMGWNGNLSNFFSIL